MAGVISRITGKGLTLRTGVVRSPGGQQMLFCVYENEQNIFEAVTVCEATATTVSPVEYILGPGYGAFT
jgi:hypothetical protein